eukprot:87912-Chlamydomonas_euryale.AAC.2
MLARPESQPGGTQSSGATQHSHACSRDKSLGSRAHSRGRGEGPGPWTTMHIGRSMWTRDAGSHVHEDEGPHR